MFALLLPIVFSQLIEVQVVVNMSNGTLFIEAENKTPAEINNACSDNFFQPYPFTYDITDMCLNEKVECNNNFNNLTSICGGLITQLTANNTCLTTLQECQTNLITQTNKAASAVILQGNLTTCLTNLSKQKGYWFWYIGGGIIIGAAGYGIAKKNKGTKVGY